MNAKPLKPFLKWAGGKRWLFQTGQFSMPKPEGRYFEPFLGGGAVFFETQPKHPVLSDSNCRLIELYTVIRDELNEFMCNLNEHARSHCRKYYYDIRGKDFKRPAARAAQFLYLNRTCWNGLYRENLKGQFNVPIGTKQAVILDSDDFQAWSNALQGSTLQWSDFEEAIDEADKGDFVFVDPPYTVRHNNNGFNKYNKNIFAWRDQTRLCSTLKRAAQRGVSFAMTNADHDCIRVLYADFGEHRKLFRCSVIAGDSIHRSRTTELLIVNGI